jgi:CRISPR-associated protein Csd2
MTDPEYPPAPSSSDAQPDAVEESVLETLIPDRGADSVAEIARCIPAEVRALYDVYSYRHAAAILAGAFPDELGEIIRALLAFRISKKDIGMPGGNESNITKKFAKSLRDQGWLETRVRSDLILRIQEYKETISASLRASKETLPPRKIQLTNNLDAHRIDFVKGRVAFDFEWNSKDQTFDRDLFALRLFHECHLISAGVLVTRSEHLNPVFQVVPQRDEKGEIKRTDSGEEIPVKGKYGGTTTWIGKLLPRLNSGRHGGCPILVFAIKPAIILDWP